MTSATNASARDRGRSRGATENAFGRRFADAWSRPTPDRLVELLHPDVVLLQPHRPPIRGREAAREEFRRLFAWLPDLHGVVDRFGGDDDLVFIEWQMKVPAEDRAISIRAVDRFLLASGLGLERRVYFDRLALVAAVSTHPSLWGGYLRYRFGR